MLFRNSVSKTMTGPGQTVVYVSFSLPFQWSLLHDLRLKQCLYVVENASIELMCGNLIPPLCSTFPQIFIPSAFAVWLQCESCRRRDVPHQHSTAHRRSYALLLLTYCTVRGERGWEMEDHEGNIMYWWLFQDFECICEPRVEHHLFISKSRGWECVWVIKRSVWLASE